MNPNGQLGEIATSDKWEPPEREVHTSCTIRDDDTVVIKNPAIPGGKIVAREVMPLQFMQ